MTIVWWSVTGLALTNVVLAAAILGLRLRSERLDRKRAAVEAAWQPRLFSLIADEVDPDELADQVANSEVDLVLELCGRFAQRLTGADLERIEGFAARFSWRLARRLHHSDVDTRARSVMLLSAIGGHRYEPALVSALDDPDPLVAMVAAQAIAKHRLARQVPRLIERVSALGVWSPAFVAGVVAGIGTTAAPALIDILASPSRPVTDRATAALALAQLHDPRAADTAVVVLEDDTAARELVTACLRILEQVGRAPHLEPIRRLLSHADFAVRARAAAAIGAMGTSADAQQLQAMVGDPSRWVGLNAAMALRRLHCDELLGDLAAGSGDSASIAAEALELEVLV
ncbi:MAG: HEAT repeat domain-containing protein [Acidimicrobiia bacterium]|nr:HEAT repeat domain-containing protein [Acidimicrobiia bacterium]